MVDSKMKQNITIKCNTAIGNAYETQYWVKIHAIWLNLYKVWKEATVCIQSL